VRVLLPGAAPAGHVAALRDLGVIYGLYSLTAVGFYVLQGTGRLLTCAAVVLATGALTLVLIGLGARAHGLRGAALGNAGYALNLVLHLVAMSSLGVGWRRWTASMAVPLLLFGSALAAETVLPPSLAARGALTALAGGALAAWALYGRGGPLAPRLQEGS
jgi:uncharacterized membrane protein